MVRNFDHLTLVVRDPARAVAFFAVLGFREAGRVVISGPKFEAFMGVAGIEAEHITLVLQDAVPHQEIQLLNYLNPPPLPNENIRDLHRLGMNHICFAVDDIDAEVARLRAAGFRTRNEVMDFRHNRLVFFDGPEGVTVELAQKAP